MMNVLLIATLLALVAWLVIQHRLHLSELRLQDKKNERVRREALRERDELLDALGDAFLLVDETSQIVFANACARTLVKGRKLIGQSIMEAFLDDQISVAIMKCIRTKQPMQERVVLYSSYTPLGVTGDDGVSAWEIDAAPLTGYESQQRNQCVTRVVIRDVTVEYQADHVRRDFVANASHELRTPMSIINGYLENLLDDDVMDEPQTARRFLETMRKHGQRISRLVEDMLMISKMESGEAMALNKEAFDFQGCVQDVIDRLDPMIAKQQATVNTKLEPSGLQLSGDRFYWTQIMFNLVENALKQNPDPGVNIVVSGAKIDGELVLSVCDNGVGIPSADLPYIFKRFYRVQKHHSQSEIKGTGLGLSIVVRAVEAHGGEIFVKSTPGQETCFTVKLPDAS
jgi:two-component system phosphate regulon sensor histidine kinase PhoR